MYPSRHFSFAPLLLCAFALTLFALTACNLGTTPPGTPTVEVTQSPVSTAVPSQPALPTLPPPSQLLTPPVTAQADNNLVLTPLVLTPPLNSGEDGRGSLGLPTLDPALADERYELQVRSGKTSIGVNVNLTLITGTVTVTLQGPTGLVWQKTFTAGENSRTEVPITQGGAYEILVQIDNFDGNYSLSWD